MLCSHCQEVIRPVVMLDIDGLLGDYHGHFQGFAEMWLGITLSDFPTIESAPRYRGGIKFSEWFCKAYDVDLTTFREIKLAYRQGAQKRSMPLNPGMGTMVRCLQAFAAKPEIWITTTRPYLNLSGIDADTRFWLSKNDIPYDYLVYDENKYAVMADRVDLSRVVLVVDDEAENLEAATTAGYPTRALVLYRTRYNARATWRGLQTKHASDIVNLFANNLREWEQRNG